MLSTLHFSPLQKIHSHLSSAPTHGTWSAQLGRHTTVIRLSHKRPTPCRMSGPKRVTARRSQTVAGQDMTKDESDPGGNLVLVVGASGVGKDTLIDAARRRFAADTAFIFPKRVITRASQADEPHIAVTEQEFRRLEADGAFFLAWQAHDTSYGIPIRAKRDLEAGRTVVINVSRTAIGPARQLWPRMRVIHVTVGPDILKDRLLARRRESQRAVERRLKRADAVAVPQEPWVHQVDNSGDVASAVARFIELISNSKNGQSGSG